MRLTEFWRRMDDKFGVLYAQSYAADQVLAELGGKTVRQALADGDEVKGIWRAVCDATSAPASERCLPPGPARRGGLVRLLVRMCSLW